MDISLQEQLYHQKTVYFYSQNLSKILLINNTSGLVNSYFKREVKGIFSARTMYPVTSPLLHLLRILWRQHPKLHLENPGMRGPALLTNPVHM